MNTRDFKDKLLELQPQLRKYARRLTSNREKAEDLLQETNLRTLENLEKFSHDINFKSWVFTIMFHVFVNEWKKWARNIFVPDLGQIKETQVRSISDNSVGYYHPVEYFDLRDAAEKCVSEMTPVNQKIWKMYNEGYHYEEIAEQTQLLLGTVKSRLHTIRFELKKSCKD